MMLEEQVKLYRFAGISPEQFSTEAGRHREAVVAADQNMVIRCFGDDFSVFVHDDFHVPPPIQGRPPISAAAMVRILSNLVRAPGVPSHEDHCFRITGATDPRTKRALRRTLIPIADDRHRSTVPRQQVTKFSFDLALSELLHNLLKHLGRIVLTTLSTRSCFDLGEGAQGEREPAASHRIERVGGQLAHALRIDCSSSHQSSSLTYPARLSNAGAASFTVNSLVAK
ncbi:hypothetical protein JQ629_20560 [Bradyrhizobium sp. AUGA SZCCT0222]|uniref:hypothetical protein n=1 Tax=Bradyrhizobium sp. AUGA SZCCT0222 TaxID=2807668 RepID=UPI001BA6F36F|nr:hypothetical protein [Bradyrhizobium sp. AUGA SZCCT0222]MBR1269912.1 hypothetical protein [Bradyrhizobium sp. AUGA SZCCT0222]